MKVISVIALGLATILAAGCATSRTVWTTQPSELAASNEYVDTTASAKCNGYGCEAFYLTIKNKTDRNIEVNWNKTYYISQGQTSGGFMFEGVVYKDRNNPKPPDIIFSKGSFSKTIWPNNLVYFSTGQYGGWRNQSMPYGENGIYLTLNIDGKEVTQKLTANLTSVQIPN